MTTTGAGPGWFTDPDGSGGLRYFDGSAWTEHRVPPPSAPPLPPGYPPNYGPGYWAPTAPGYAAPYGPGYGAGYAPWASPWKGARLGRPPFGPGALADPGRRLAARLLDGVLFLGLFAVLAAVAIPIAAPHFGPIFPKVSPDRNASLPTPGFVWLYLVVAACGLATGIVAIAYETFTTTRYGRTLGKRWMHIRPLRGDGTTLSGWRALGRAVIQTLFGFLSWIGLLDPLWCLWDDNRQCLHDKVADTIVVNDPVAAPEAAPEAASEAHDAD